MVWGFLKNRSMRSSLCTACCSGRTEFMSSQRFTRSPQYGAMKLRLDIIRKATWYRHGRAQGSDGDRCPEWQRQVGNGIHCRNQGQQHPAVYPQAARRTACHLERGDLGSLALRLMSRRKLMYSVGTSPPEEKSDLCSLDRIRGGNILGMVSDGVTCAFPFVTAQ